MGIRYVDVMPSSRSSKERPAVVCNVYQVFQSSKRAKKDLLVVYNRYQVCGIMPSNSSSKKSNAGGLLWISGMCDYIKLQEKKDLLVVSNGYQVCDVIRSCSMCKEGPADGF